MLDKEWIEEFLENHGFCSISISENTIAMDATNEISGKDFEEVTHFIENLGYGHKLVSIKPGDSEESDPSFFTLVYSSQGL